jgi:thymidylate synthase (FAD)
MTHSVEILWPERLMQEHEITRFARVSHDGSAYAKEDEARWKRLIWRMMRQGHTTPFRHAHIHFEIVCALDVKEQLCKHAVGFDKDWPSNAMSLRYTKAVEIDQIKVRARAADIKQGSVPFASEEQSRYLRRVANSTTQFAASKYDALLESGVAPESARRVLPMATMTRWLSTGSLLGWLSLINQRTAPDAQLETQAVANSIAEKLRPYYPYVFACNDTMVDQQMKMREQLELITWNEV